MNGQNHSNDLNRLIKVNNPSVFNDFLLNFAEKKNQKLETKKDYLCELKKKNIRKVDCITKIKIQNFNKHSACGSLSYKNHDNIEENKKILIEDFNSKIPVLYNRKECTDDQQVCSLLSNCCKNLFIDGIKNLIICDCDINEKTSNLKSLFEEQVNYKTSCYDLKSEYYLNKKESNVQDLEEPALVSNNFTCMSVAENLRLVCKQVNSSKKEMICLVEEGVKGAQCYQLYGIKNFYSTQITEAAGKLKKKIFKTVQTKPFIKHLADSKVKKKNHHFKSPFLYFTKQCCLNNLKSIYFFYDQHNVDLIKQTEKFVTIIEINVNFTKKFIENAVVLTSSSVSNHNCESDSETKENKFLTSNVNKMNDVSSVLNGLQNQMQMNSKLNYLSSLSSRDFSSQLMQHSISMPSINTSVVSVIVSNNLNNSLHQNVHFITEKIVIFRQIGEKIGMALKFEGGANSDQNIERVFIQNVNLNSPASKAIGEKLGSLKENDELLCIENRPVNTMSRLDCVSCLRDANDYITLLVRGARVEMNISKTLSSFDQNSSSLNHLNTLKRNSKGPPPIIPPRMSTTVLTSTQLASNNGSNQNSKNFFSDQNFKKSSEEKTSLNGQSTNLLQKNSNSIHHLGTLKRRPTQPPPLPPRKINNDQNVNLIKQIENHITSNDTNELMFKNKVFIDDHNKEIIDTSDQNEIFNSEIKSLDSVFEKIEIKSVLPSSNFDNKKEILLSNTDNSIKVKSVSSFDQTNNNIETTNVLCSNSLEKQINLAKSPTIAYAATIPTSSLPQLITNNNFLSTASNYQYMDLTNQHQSNYFESDTDDTESSVSTVIERSSRTSTANSSFSEKCNLVDPNQIRKDQSRDSQLVSFEKVLNSFECLEQELDQSEETNVHLNNLNFDQNKLNSFENFIPKNNSNEIQRDLTLLNNKNKNFAEKTPILNLEANLDDYDDIQTVSANFNVNEHLSSSFHKISLSSNIKNTNSIKEYTENKLHLKNLKQEKSFLESSSQVIDNLIGQDNLQSGYDNLKDHKLIYETVINLEEVPKNVKLDSLIESSVFNDERIVNDKNKLLYVEQLKKLAINEDKLKIEQINEELKENNSVENLDNYKQVSNDLIDKNVDEVLFDDDRKIELEEKVKDLKTNDLKINFQKDDSKDNLIQNNPLILKNSLNNSEFDLNKQNNAKESFEQEALINELQNTKLDSKNDNKLNQKKIFIAKKQNITNQNIKLSTRNNLNSNMNPTPKNKKTNLFEIKNVNSCVKKTVKSNLINKQNIALNTTNKKMINSEKINTNTLNLDNQNDQAQKKVIKKACSSSKNLNIERSKPKTIVTKQANQNILSSTSNKSTIKSEKCLINSNSSKLNCQNKKNEENKTKKKLNNQSLSSTGILKKSSRNINLKLTNSNNSSSSSESSVHSINLSNNYQQLATGQNNSQQPFYTNIKVNRSVSSLNLHRTNSLKHVLNNSQPNLLPRRCKSIYSLTSNFNKEKPSMIPRVKKNDDNQNNQSILPKYLKNKSVHNSKKPVTANDEYEKKIDEKNKTNLKTCSTIDQTEINDFSNDNLFINNSINVELDNNQSKKTNTPNLKTNKFNQNNSQKCFISDSEQLQENLVDDHATKSFKIIDNIQCLKDIENVSQEKNDKICCDSSSDSCKKTLYMKNLMVRNFEQEKTDLDCSELNISNQSNTVDYINVNLSLENLSSEDLNLFITEINDENKTFLDDTLNYKKKVNEETINYLNNSLNENQNNLNKVNKNYVKNTNKSKIDSLEYNNGLDTEIRTFNSNNIIQQQVINDHLMNETLNEGGVELVTNKNTGVAEKVQNLKTFNLNFDSKQLCSSKQQVKDLEKTISESCDNFNFLSVLNQNDKDFNKKLVDCQKELSILIDPFDEPNLKIDNVNSYDLNSVQKFVDVQNSNNLKMHLIDASQVLTQNKFSKMNENALIKTTKIGNKEIITSDLGGSSSSTSSSDESNKNINENDDQVRSSSGLSRKDSVSSSSSSICSSSGVSSHSSSPSEQFNSLKTKKSSKEQEKNKKPINDESNPWICGKATQTKYSPSFKRIALKSIDSDKKNGQIDNQFINEEQNNQKNNDLICETIVEAEPVIIDNDDQVNKELITKEYSVTKENHLDFNNKLDKNVYNFFYSPTNYLSTKKTFNLSDSEKSEEISIAPGFEENNEKMFNFCEFKAKDFQLTSKTTLSSSSSSSTSACSPLSSNNFSSSSSNDLKKNLNQLNKSDTNLNNQLINQISKSQSLVKQRQQQIEQLTTKQTLSLNASSRLRSLSSKELSFNCSLTSSTVTSGDDEELLSSSKQNFRAIVEKWKQRASNSDFNHLINSMNNTSLTTVNKTCKTKIKTFDVWQSSVKNTVYSSETDLNNHSFLFPLSNNTNNVAAVINTLNRVAASVNGAPPPLPPKPKPNRALKTLGMISNSFMQGNSASTTALNTFIETDTKLSKSINNLKAKNLFQQNENQNDIFSYAKTSRSMSVSDICKVFEKQKGLVSNNSSNTSNSTNSSHHLDKIKLSKNLETRKRELFGKDLVVNSNENEPKTKISKFTPDVVKTCVDNLVTQHKAKSTSNLNNLNKNDSIKSTQSFENSESSIKENDLEKNIKINSNTPVTNVKSLSNVSNVKKDENTFLINQSTNFLETAIKTNEREIQVVKPNTDKYTIEVINDLIEQASKSIEKELLSQNIKHTIEVIILKRECARTGSIGITLAGGVDYENKEITVHKIINGSLAHRDGRLEKGDRILSINGILLKEKTHKEALEILKKPLPEVVLVVFHNLENTSSDVNNLKTNFISFKLSKDLSFSNRELSTSNPNLLTSNLSTSSSLFSLTNTNTKNSLTDNFRIYKANLIKDGAALGFILEGGKDSPLGDKPLTIKRIFKGGPADKEGTLLLGDEIICVNNIAVYTMTRTEAWNYLKKLPDGPVSVVVRRKI